MLRERGKELAIWIAVEARGGAVCGTYPKLHMPENHEHEIDGVEGEANAAACCHTKRWNDAVVTTFGVII